MTEQHTTYFDLHTQGLGYLHRAREVTPKRGQPFLAVEISALHGAEDAVQYTRFDTRVSGREAQAIVRELMPAIEAEKRVLSGSSSAISMQSPSSTRRARSRARWASGSRPGSSPSTGQRSTASMPCGRGPRRPRRPGETRHEAAEMDREDWIDLYRWLEAAKPGEIFARRDKAREVLRQLRDPDIRADVRRIIREMDRELVARADLARLRKRA